MPFAEYLRSIREQSEVDSIAKALTQIRPYIQAFGAKEDEHLGPIAMNPVVAEQPGPALGESDLEFA